MSKVLQKYIVFGITAIAMVGVANWLLENSNHQAGRIVEHVMPQIVKNTKTIPPTQALSALVETAGKGPSAVATSKSADSLKGLLAQEKGILYKHSLNWVSHEEELKRKVSQFSHSQLMSLAKNTVSETMDSDERQIGVYLLSLAGIQAREALTYIVKAKVPDVSRITDLHAATTKSEQEISLRLNALAALDVLAIQKPKEIHQDLQNIVLVQNESSLKNFAQISLVGIAQGKPGKLSRWLNQLTSASKESL